MKLQQKKIVNGVTIIYHINRKTIFAKGKMKDDIQEGYWEWFRVDGTLKRSGYFENGVQVGEWTTYDKYGKVYKVTDMEKVEKKEDEGSEDLI
jgi:antitoxin component YwqK of YwqJK toxin-antitoxin module